MTCFGDEQKCNTTEFPIKKSDTRECFKSKDECFQRDFYFISNNICYNQCPNDYPFINNEVKECFKTKEDCIERRFKVLNKECFNNCPQNSEDKNNNSICLCSYNYFNNSNFLNCFNQTDNCKSKGYDYTNIDTNECFNTKEDCIGRGYKILNKGCYIDCPQNTEDKNNNSF